MQIKLFPRGFSAWLIYLILHFFLGCLAPAFAEQAEQIVNVLVAYHSNSGNTEKMAQAVVKGAESVPGTRVRLSHIHI